MRFEAENTPERLDAERERILRHYEARARELQPARKRWLRGVHPKLRRIYRDVHGPLIQAMMRDGSVDGEPYEDVNFFEDLARGFNLVGELSQCHVGAAPLKKTYVPVTVEELRAARRNNN